MSGPNCVISDFTSLTTADEDRFAEMAEAVFRFQVERTEVYRRFAGEHRWEGWQHAPHLPIDAFKLARVAAFSGDDAQAVFVSSGTGSISRAHHYVRDLSIYDRSILAHYDAILGRSRRTIIAHLPGYESASSLVYMMRTLIRERGDGNSGFFLEDAAPLHRAIAGGGPVLLVGAAFGLLDLIERAPAPMPEGSVVIETGGMKTHRREIARGELHAQLADGFGVDRQSVLSEYGMCELLSQCYTRGGEVFYPPPWMRMRIVDPTEPSTELPSGSAGAIVVVDLANIHSASFILTKDRGVQDGDGIRILGRLGGAELRGCNFLLEDHG